MIFSTFLSVLRILAVPVLVMAGIHGVFALLSFSVFNDAVYTQFLTSAVVSALLAAALYGVTMKSALKKINAHAALLYTVFTWFVLAVIASIPIVLITSLDFTRAYFESVSALTTTGATVLEGLDSMAPTFLLYRQFLQWLGGLGVVIFVVAILPMLNVGGMQLLRAETPGPVKDEKLAPRIASSAQYLWSVYIALTVFCVVGYMLAGMSAYEAIAHSFTTVATGGFSTHDASLGYFQSPAIEYVANFFMIAGAVAFPLHFYFYKKRDLRVYFYDTEFKVFIAAIAVLSVLVYCTLALDTENHTERKIASSVFHVISLLTSTGYTAESINGWPSAALLLLVIAGYLGGCAGSTTGGGKMIRFILISKLIGLQAKKLIYSRGEFVVKYKGMVVSGGVMSSTMSFFMLTFLINIICVILVMATGLDFWTAFTAVSTCQNVVGPAFGELGNNFVPASDPALWVFTFCMLLGRLEYFTVLVIFSRRFWRN